MKGVEEKYFLFEQVVIEVKKFKSDGFILDVGGGGEGVIGRLKGKDVVAIDFKKEELEEAADGPLKIVMDARELQFLDNSFNTATAFFSLMYLKTQVDQQKAFEEIGRVLRPGGHLLVWDIDLSERPEPDKEFYVVQLRYRVGGEEFGTGYGQRWPKETRSTAYYIELAGKAGLQHIQTEKNKHAFYLLFQKRS